MSYTVFGEVISGLDVVDKIANVPTDENNRPLENIRMKITMLK
jgi:peptidyl-prolyl cis-trans isomerase B (cyclophilin B)